MDGVAKGSKMAATSRSRWPFVMPPELVSAERFILGERTRPVHADSAVSRKGAAAREELRQPRPDHRGLLR